MNSHVPPNRRPPEHLPNFRRSGLRDRSLRFSPTAWAKLLFLRDWGETEVGGFGITETSDLLLVTDLKLVKQSCSAISVAFEDAAVADFFDDQVDRGLEPEQFSRIWIHTHPGHCPLPSSMDEATFNRVFGATEWSLMFILARLGATYARLSFNQGPGGDLELPVGVDYSRSFLGSDPQAWRAEYIACVECEELLAERSRDRLSTYDHEPPWRSERNWDA